MRIFFDGVWYEYDAQKGIVKESGFFLFETAKGLYPYEVMTDIKNKVNA
jgi:hypothetical protein